MEYELGAKVSGGINISVSTILRHGQMPGGAGGGGADAYGICGWICARNAPVRMTGRLISFVNEEMIRR